MAFGGQGFGSGGVTGVRPGTEHEMGYQPKRAEGWGGTLVLAACYPVLWPRRAAAAVIERPRGGVGLVGAELLASLAEGPAGVAWTGATDEEIFGGILSACQGLDFDVGQRVCGVTMLLVSARKGCVVTLPSLPNIEDDPIVPLAVSVSAPLEAELGEVEPASPVDAEAEAEAVLAGASKSKRRAREARSRGRSGRRT
jgi:hypothetical protein